MSVIEVMGKPSNLVLPPGTGVMPVEGDLYNICQQLHDLWPQLHVVLLTHDEAYAFAVMEEAKDGTMMLVKKYKELDGRVMKDFQRYFSLSLEARVAERDKEAEKRKAEYEEARFEEFYENFGGPMYTELERCGFIQRRESYAKTGVTGGHGSKAKAQ